LLKIAEEAFDDLKAGLQQNFKTVENKEGLLVGQTSDYFKLFKLDAE